MSARTPLILRRASGPTGSASKDHSKRAESSNACFEAPLRGAPQHEGGGDHLLSEGRARHVPTLGAIGLDNFAPYLMNRIVARWNADLSEELKAHGLSTVQMRALAVLSIMSGATVSELSVYTVTEQSTMSRTLDGMEREGLIRRKHRSGDMRVREIHVTERGRETFRRFWPDMHAALERMFAGFSEAEYQTLIRLLTRMLHNIRRHEI